MRVLVTGASGFIGRAVVDALLQQGHDVVRASRRPAPLGAACQGVAVDFAQVPSTAWWTPRLSGIDAVVNAVGILRERDGQTFKALHADAPIELFRACAAAGVPQVVQISALGADASARSRYHRSKKAADDVLRSLPLRSAVVQPSLVYGAAGASARMFNRMAVLPLLALPRRGGMQVQPVHLDDVAAGVLALLRSPQQQPCTIAFVGPRPLTLRDYLAQLRALLGKAGPLRVVPLPVFLFRWGASLAAHVPGSSLDSETAGMLLRGNAASSDAFARLLGRTPKAVTEFLDAGQAVALGREAILGVWLPLLRMAVALLWVWTGLVSLGLYPVADSLALLGRVGLHGIIAQVALYGAAGLDLLLGAATLLAPPRWRGAVWVTQLLLIGAYTVLISVFLPEYWLHPYGPITKNLPLMAAIGLSWALEPAPQSRGSR